MDHTIIETVLSWALTAVKTYPPLTIYLATAGTIAAVILLAQPVLKSLVEWTDTMVLKWVLFVADKLTPSKSVRGAKIATKAEVDRRVVANIVKAHGGAADVPAVVLETLTPAQKNALADAYVEEATSTQPSLEEGA